MTKAVPLYRIEVDVAGLPRFVGHAYRDKAAAHSWIPFVKSAWHSRRARVVQVASMIGTSPARGDDEGAKG